jgi:hypothetical protein
MAAPPAAARGAVRVACSAQRMGRRFHMVGTVPGASPRVSERIRSCSPLRFHAFRFPTGYETTHRPPRWLIRSCTDTK